MTPGLWAAGHHDDLDGGDLRGQHQAVVVAVGHDDAADQTGGHAPGGLVRIDPLVVGVGEGDVEGAGEAVAEVVGGAGLQGLAVMHHALDGVGGLGAVELLLLGLLAPGHGHGQHVFAEVGVDVQHALGLLHGLLGGGVHGVALLPEEFAVAQEGAGGLLPAQHAAPLVVHLGQVPVGLDDIFIVLAEQGLGGGTDAVALLELVAAAHGDPGALRGKALHVVLFLLQQAFGDEHGHVDVFSAGLFELNVHQPLDVFPDGVAVGAIDEHALDGGIVDELRLGAHVGVPLGKILLHVGDSFDFHLFCHDFLHPFGKFISYLFYHICQASA